MRSDVTELRRFYEGPLGRAAGLVLAERVRRRWPALGGMQVLGLGYAPPLLDGLDGGAAPMLAAMPAGQGALRWPAENRCRTVLTEEDALPFPDLAFDRVLLAHDVETSDHLAGRLREVWRILAAEGRLMVVAPSRRGLWARFEHTPFGHGRPLVAFATGAALARGDVRAARQRGGAVRPAAPPAGAAGRGGGVGAVRAALPARVRRGGDRRSREAPCRGHARARAVAPEPARRRAGSPGYAAAGRRSSLRAASQPISAALRASPHS